MLREDFLEIPEVKEKLNEYNISMEECITIHGQTIRQGEELYIRKWCGINPANSIKSKEKGLIGNILFSFGKNLATAYFPEWDEKGIGHTGWFNIDIRGNDSGWYNSYLRNSDVDFDVTTTTKIIDTDLSNLF